MSLVVPSLAKQNTTMSWKTVRLETEVDFELKVQTSVFSSLILDNDFGPAVWHSIEQKRLGRTMLTMLTIISPS